MMLPCKINACNLLALDDELSFAKSFHLMQPYWTQLVTELTFMDVTITISKNIASVSKECC